MKRERPTPRQTSGRSAFWDEELEEGSDPSAEDVHADELREFLEADECEVEADPLFRERLRRRLWSIVRERFGRGPSGSSDA